MIRRYDWCIKGFVAFCLWFAAANMISHAEQPYNSAPIQGSASAAGDTQTKLKKEVESLQSFAGVWHCQGVFPSSGKKIESQIAFTQDLEGAWLLVRHDDIPPNQFHALEMWGFDKEAKQFVAFIYDNFGGVRKFTSPGWEEQNLVWMGETSSSTPPSTQRFVFKRDSAEQFIVNWEVKKGTADWVVGDALTCKK
jgi:hypothetical protein